MQVRRHQHCKEARVCCLELHVVSALEARGNRDFERRWHQGVFGQLHSHHVPPPVPIRHLCREMFAVCSEDERLPTVRVRRDLHLELSHTEAKSVTCRVCRSVRISVTRSHDEHRARLLRALEPKEARLMSATGSEARVHTRTRAR